MILLLISQEARLERKDYDYDQDQDQEQELTAQPEFPPSRTPPAREESLATRSEHASISSGASAAFGGAW